MTKLIICRGLPASGKTTAAKKWAAEDPVSRVRVNRDDLRQMLHGGEWSYEIERVTRSVRDAAIRDALKRGVSVVCDDTNLDQRTARDVARLGRLNDAEIEVWDMTDVPLDECLRRDGLRDRSVGPDMIKNMHDRFLVNGRDMSVIPTDDDSFGTPYESDWSLPSAIMVDIDGTVALRGTRSPFDETRVHEDRPNDSVINAVRAAHRAGFKVIFCSGRTEGCRTATRKWLTEHVRVPYELLLMRTVNDRRNDAIVKLELFDKYIRKNYNVHWVYDDRNRVVDSWRAIGLPVFQVAPGDF